MKLVIVGLGLAGYAACYGSATWPEWAELRGVFGFAIGFVCCSLWRHYAFPARMTNLLGVMACIVAAASILNLIPRIFLIAAFSILVYCTVGDAGFVGKVLSQAPLTWLGERSYSLYLWHYPIIIFFHRLLLYSHVQTNGRASLERRVVATGMIVFACVAIAEVSYRYFECPARDWLRRYLSGRSNSRERADGLVSAS